MVTLAERITELNEAADTVFVEWLDKDDMLGDEARWNAYVPGSGTIHLRNLVTYGTGGSCSQEIVHIVVVDGKTGSEVAYWLSAVPVVLQEDPAPTTFEIAMETLVNSLITAGNRVVIETQDNVREYAIAQVYSEVVIGEDTFAQMTRWYARSVSMGSSELVAYPFSEV